jgi:8-oxo-dGTP pyrophosphatase MutT (NUDIX family)
MFRHHRCVVASFSINDIAEKLAEHRPQLSGIRFEDAVVRAAVAAVLRDGANGPEVLFIRRAEHEGDPWSGHIAFPGGRVDSAEEQPRQAAERETLEEVCLDLGEADYLGQLDDLEGTKETVVVSAFVYRCSDAASLRLNYEVKEVCWFPLRDLNDPSRQVVKTFDYLEHPVTLPALRVFDGENVPLLWGITYRFTELLMEHAGQPIPSMPWI